MCSCVRVSQLLTTLSIHPRLLTRVGAVRLSGLRHAFESSHTLRSHGRFLPGHRSGRDGRAKRQGRGEELMITRRVHTVHVGAAPVATQVHSSLSRLFACKRNCQHSTLDRKLDRRLAARPSTSGLTMGLTLSAGGLTRHSRHTTRTWSEFVPR